MGPALGCLCFIIVVFSHYLVLDAMLSYGADMHGQRDNYHLRQGRYVTMFIVNVGAFRGYLRPLPKPQGYVHNLFSVRVSDSLEFWAEMVPFKIEANEHLTENRYFTQIGKTFVASSALRPYKLLNEARVKLEMRQTPFTQDRFTLHGGISYYDGAIPAWTLESYIQSQNAGSRSTTSRRPSSGQ